MPELVCAADDPRWLDERRAGVTATDIVAITGLSPYESEYGLYWKKLGHIPDTHEDTPRMRLGRDLEPLIVSRWLDHMAVSAAHREGAYSALYRSSERPWQLATPDRVFFDEPLEVKSWADADRHAWADGPPPRVRARVLWQMDTLDVAVGHVGVLFLPSGEFRSYVLQCECEREADTNATIACELHEDIMMMRAAGEEFMARLRHELPPPSPDASSATLAALKARFTDPAKTKEAEIEAWIWEDWKSWKDAEDEAETQRKHLEIKIREQAGDAGILTVAGVPVARHTVSVIKAHHRKESKRDSITRIKNGETDGSA